MAVKNRVVHLMGIKQAREGRIINASVVARETGLTRAAISKWARQEVKTFHEDMIDLLCDYFACEIGDLLYREADSQSSINSMN